jgi:four helix bundle protein
MSTFKSFQDIEAWQKARLLTSRIYSESNSGKFQRDFGLRDQIRRASVAVMSNIAEGFERAGNKEFLQFLSIAKGSAGEVKSQLFVALDQSYISKEHFDELLGLANEISQLIGGLMRYLRSSTMKGAKYK